MTVIGPSTTITDSTSSATVTTPTTTTPAQTVPGAPPPTRGALASDGPGGAICSAARGCTVPTPPTPASRWLVAERRLHQRLESTTIPNSYNAGDFSPRAWRARSGGTDATSRCRPARSRRYVPAADRSWLIEFESVNYAATVWLNGHELGTHAGGYLPFEFPLSDLRAGVNRLIVRVDDRRTGADFPPGPSGGWWNFGGLLDVVYLRPVQRADLDQVMIRPELPCPQPARRRSSSRRRSSTSPAPRRPSP